MHQRRMSGFVEGTDRSQSTFFPALLDDYVAEDNLVRVVDAFVEGLDLGKLGFGRVAPLEKDVMGRAARTMAPSSLQRINGAPHATAKRFEQIPRNSRTRCNTNHAVIEMGQSSWLVAGIVAGVERSPLKKLAVDESALLKLLNRWREEAEKAGHRIERIAIAFEAGRDGFWLARWLRARGWRRRQSGNIGRMIWPRVARPFQDNSSGAVRGIVERRSHNNVSQASY